MRLLGAPAIPAPGLHPFLITGICRGGLRKACCSARPWLTSGYCCWFFSPPAGLARRPGLIRDPGFSESRHRSHRGHASRGGVAEINRWSDGAWLSCHFKTWLSDRAAFLNELCSTGIATYLRNMLSNAAMGHVLRHNALSRIDAPTKVQREARIWRGRSNESSGKQGLLLAAEQTSRLRIWGSGVQISSGAPDK